MRSALLLCIMVATVSTAPQGHLGHDGKAVSSTTVYEDRIEIQKPVLPSILHRQRRGLMDWFKKYFSRTSENIDTKATVSNGLIEQSTTSRPSPKEMNALSYHGDTDVNFLGVRPRNNPDAELVDMNLLSYNDVLDTRGPDTEVFNTIRPQASVTDTIEMQADDFDERKPFLGVSKVKGFHSEDFDAKEPQSYVSGARLKPTATLNEPISADVVPFEPISSPLSYQGDTDVNYVDVETRDNPDAEVFDIELFKEKRGRDLAKRDEPLRTQLPKSQAKRMQPVSQPSKSQKSFHGDTDVNYVGIQPLENLDAEIFNKELIKQQRDNYRSVPMAPIPIQPIVPQHIRSQPAIPQLIKSLPRGSQHIRSQPRKSQFTRSQTRRVKMVSPAHRSQPYTSGRLRYIGGAHLR
ncbi:hypothetical protein SK128_003915 [Halocaridina rubra]|uniref:Uncharacterized protein n=1 Tax=Halocaridina rubra TaxID=373956 RepID=A0AAN9A4L4_HALRR